MIDKTPELPNCITELRKNQSPTGHSWYLLNRDGLTFTDLQHSKEAVATCDDLTSFILDSFNYLAHDW